MSLDNEPINWGDFYQAYTGLQFSIQKEGDCRVFVPTYTNTFYSITPETSAIGTEMTFKDEWSSNSYVIDGSTEKINEVLLKNLWNYAQNNIIWDDVAGQLSFKDIQVEEITLYDFVKNIDSFLVIHKLSKFGNVWWSQNVRTNCINNNTKYENVFISTSTETSSNTFIKFWSPDKWINDEYKRYLADPTTYNGFLGSNDFINGGWFTVPDLTISTKPFEKLKAADILLNLNYTFDPKPYFGHFYFVNSRLGARIKDATSTTILDETISKNGPSKANYSGNIVSHWSGGLVSTANISNIGSVGNYPVDSCEQKNNDINYKTTTANINEISHRLDGQISLNPDYDITKRSFLGTIDSINWKSAENSNNSHNIGVLNQSRAFARSSGTRDNGIVAGGLSTNSDSITKKTQILSNAEVWQGNGFLKNLSISINTPRAYHVQGGNGSNSCAIIGGYSEFNTEDYKEFGEYSKSGLLNNVEVFIRNDDPQLSYFKTVANLQTILSRGDHAGYINVETTTRQDKFEIENKVKNYNLTEDDEQILLDFVRSKSEQDINTANTVRYSISNINGFVYGGNLSGKSNLLKSSQENYLRSNNTNYDEISAIFEEINSTNIIASENNGSISSGLIIEDIPQEIIKDVVAIDGTSETGASVQLEKCGKYRIEYLEGGFGSDDDGIVINSAIIVHCGDSEGETVDVKYKGKYRLTLLNSTDSMVDVGTSSSSANYGTYPCRETIEPSLSIPGWDDFGTKLALPYAGDYQLRFIEGRVNDPGTGGNVPPPEFNYTIDNTSAGVQTVINKCGKYRFNFTSGYYTYSILIGSQRGPRYFATHDIYINNIFQQSIWEGIFGSPEELENYFKPRYVDICIDAWDENPVTLKIVPRYYDYGVGSSGTISLSVSNIGPSDCICTNALTPVDVFVNDNYDSVAFEIGSLHTFHVEQPSSELRVRYHDPTGNWDDNNDKYGSVVVEVCYMGSASTSGSAGLNVFVNDILAQEAFVGQLSDPGSHYDFCVPYNNSKVKLVGNPLIENILNMKLTYIGNTSDCTGNKLIPESFYNLDVQSAVTSSNYYSSEIIAYINNQLISDTIFDAQAGTQEDLEFYLKSKPSLRQYDFCSSVPNSTLKLLTSGFGVGSENVRILYLGQSNCECIENYSPQTNTSTIQGNEATVQYVRINNELEYPVRCHGMVYVGDDTSGLSTGGRCEYNNISNVITRLYEKYRNGYNTVIDTSSTRSELEKDRILDLVYELKDGTWIRRQNMLESVYWHCGVGDISHALFWGGIHPTIGSTTVEILDTHPDVTQIKIDDFICDDDTKYFSENVKSLAGKDYVDIISGSNSCWTLPTWKMSFTDDELFNDPRYRSDQETLQYSNDENYPKFTLYSVAPSNPTSISPQDTENININHNLGNTIVNLTKQLTEGGTFRALAYIDGTQKTTTGTVEIQDINFTIESNTTPIYPTNIKNIFNHIKSFSLTDIYVRSTGLVELYYSLEETFSYSTLSGNITSGNYEFSGVGKLVFSSLKDIYDSIQENTYIDAITHNFTLIKSSEIDTLPIDLEGTKGRIIFAMQKFDGVMIGIEGWKQSWSSALSDCGPDISNIIEMSASFNSPYQQRWGVPLWSQLLMSDTGIFGLTFSFEHKLESVDNTFNIGNISYETTTVNISATTLGAILNERLMLIGNTVKQNHEYIAMNNMTLPEITAGLCETIAPSSSMTVSFSGMGLSGEYSEWSSSFIQEYYSDKRYDAPDKWVPSNAIGLEPSQEITSKKTSWKRYMDGVGLGGDTPDYDTIYDYNLEKLKDSQYWGEINRWFIGQTAFGTPNSAIIVGGHKVGSDVGNIGKNCGYHATDTSNRTFIWDFTNISEEDSYLKNYLGRRLFTYYNKSQIEDAQSSLSTVIFNIESENIVERQGSILFDGNVTTQTVTFDDKLPESIGTNYSITLSPNDNIKCWWTDKTETGFTINIETKFKGTIDYSISAIQTITEKDIEDLDPLDGYIF